MKRIIWIMAFTIGCMNFTVHLEAQKTKNKKAKEESAADSHPLDSLNLKAMKFRSIGPAFTSGRISDFAVNPDNPFEYYVAVSSGGVWKTVNNGTTYTPIFDNEGSYSIGCITMDPSNHNILWVGTGENNNQRSVAYGDGVYKSLDGGNSWKNMGLKDSEHIGKIIVHPDNSDIVWTAAIGPLWNKGGDRGVYKTTDGGDNWERVLEIDEHTGVTDIVIDPRDPDILYAAAFQRARHVFTYLGGGPGSSIYKTTDGGENWVKTDKGLPETDLGRIGLAISPANPDIIYAIVEAAQGKSGFYKSTNGGATWEKQSSHVTSGNYYQEIIADPVDEDIVYSMDTWLQATEDGGKNFFRVGEDTKHVDNHCIWINPANNYHWLVGCDGGIYETFDAAQTWNFKSNLPVTQFYKVSVDNDYPFYNIYGGTQDNFSIGGPSRTITDHGIMNSDWYITHGGDGFETQVDPDNPDIVYSQSQYGVLVRYDRKSGEEVGIQPQPRKGENEYRWNWDAPLQVSHHVPGRIYFAANKVFRSDDYGNSWEVISDDLTRQINRNELEIMDRVWSLDAVAKNRSTSPYGTIVAFSESPLNKDLLVAGTDDGLIRISNNGGQSWKKVDRINGVPERSYVNAVFCSAHDRNVIYAAFNHHKYGDYKPYILRSRDMGQSWESISSNLPERGSVYSIAEDPVNKDLLFCGTEFGVFFSPNGGKRWKQLKNGVPVIAVRDIAIQERENDLVLGTFGRGFYVLDDYSSLRSLVEDIDSDTAQIFPIRTAVMFEKSRPLGLPGKSFQGDNFYSGENLGPVALIDYYYPRDDKSLEDQRREKEKEAAKEGEANPYPSYETYRKEKEEMPPFLMFTIRNSTGDIVRKIEQPASKGLQRLEWDLRYAYKEPVELGGSEFYNPFGAKPEGSLIEPGDYTVSMSRIHNGQVTPLVSPVLFTVKALENTVLPASDRGQKVEFQQEVSEFSRKVEGTRELLKEMRNRMKYMKKAIELADEPMDDLIAEYYQLDRNLDEISFELNGDPLKSKLDIDQPPTPVDRLGHIRYYQKYSTADPTETHRMSLAIAREEFQPILDRIRTIATEDMERLEQKLEDANAPYTPGRALKMIE